MKLLEAKKHMNSTVYYTDESKHMKGIPFMLTGIISRLEKGDWKYFAELWDSKTNCIVITEFKKITGMEWEEKHNYITKNANHIKD